MQERGAMPPYPEPADAPARGPGKPNPRRSRLLGCGCLGFLALAALIITAAVASSGGGTPSAGSPPGPTGSSGAPPQSTTAAAPGGVGALSGFGASVETWDTARNPDQDFTGASAYGADATLPRINGHTGARYVTVQTAFDRVVAYQVNFHPHTSIAAALAEVLHTEFPADATYLWKRTVPGQCYQAEVKSPQLAKALAGTQVGDGTGLVFLEAKTLAPGGAQGFNAGDVTYATLTLQSVTGADQAPGC